MHKLLQTYRHKPSWLEEWHDVHWPSDEVVTLHLKVFYRHLDGVVTFYLILSGNMCFL